MNIHYPLLLFVQLSSPISMLESVRSCLNPLQRRARAFLRHLKAMNNVNRRGTNDGRRFLVPFELLSPSFPTMEIHNQFEQVFKLIDRNGDGKISSRELCELFLCLGFEISEASSEAEGMVKEMDSNGDGFVDLEEFINAMNGNDEKEKEESLVDAFEILDGDKNGLISAKDLNKVLTRLGFENCSLKQCKLMIAGVDKDGDGFVNFHEFQSMMASRSATTLSLSLT